MMKPLTKIIDCEYEKRTDFTIGSLYGLLHDDEFKPLHEFFCSYPETSLMSDYCRVLLYQLVRTIQPVAVAEIGTYKAGTAEVICRALYDVDAGGKLWTVDPYDNGAMDNFTKWPPELYDRWVFIEKNSMGFFSEQPANFFDLILVDGNHEFEFALFDLGMAARKLKPGGIIIMDNAEQTGPFYATKQFLQHNPGWKEIGNGLAIGKQFNRNRSSIEGTSFLILQKPKSIIVSDIPVTTGEITTPLTTITGISFRFENSKRKTGRG